MPLVEVAHERLNPRPEGPTWLQTGRIGADRRHPALRTGRRRLPRLDHHRLERWELADVTAPDPPSPGLRQLLATSRTRARAARDDHVRLATHPTDPNVPTLRAVLSAPARLPVRLLASRRWHRRVLGRLLRPPELRQFLFKLTDLLVPALDGRLTLGQLLLLPSNHLDLLDQYLHQLLAP